MGVRSINSATISFGLVAAPVSVYTAVGDPESISFNLIHGDCGSRLRQQMVCEKDGEVVPRDQATKGYEFEKGKYVLFSSDEIKALEAERTNLIAIQEFVPQDQIDPRLFEKAYYLGPDKAGEKAFWLLHEAMVKSGKAGIAKYATRGKEYLVAVMPSAGTLGMFQLRYTSEIRSVEKLGLNPAAVNAAELKLALTLVNQQSAKKFSPEKYEDEIKGRIAEKIATKLKTGKAITITKTKAPTPSVDLMKALKRSLKVA